MEAPVPFRSLPVERLGEYNVKVSVSDGPMYVIVYWTGRPEPLYWVDDAKKTALVATFDDEVKARAFLNKLAGL